MTMLMSPLILRGDFVVSYSVGRAQAVETNMQEKLFLLFGGFDTPPRGYSTTEAH